MYEMSIVMYKMSIVMYKMSIIMYKMSIVMYKMSIVMYMMYFYLFYVTSFNAMWNVVLVYVDICIISKEFRLKNDVSLKYLKLLRI
jgi:hypothetical protein